MPYSAEGDLLVGDLLLPAGFSKATYITEATDEIDSKLGFIYQLPLTPIPPEVALPPHEVLLLKVISNKLSSGRLIMDIALAGERYSLHAYGRRLVDEAMNDLLLIANGELELAAVRSEANVALESAKVPSVKNHDEESLLLGFENVVLRQEPWYSRPGVVS
jgi:hypothetical protein